MEQLIKYKADEELLRLIFLEGFGYSNKELAQMLQTTESFIKKMKASMVNNESDALPIEKTTSKFGINDQRFKRSDNFLRYFFMNIRETDGINSQKKFDRCYAILSLLHEKNATYREIEGRFEQTDQSEDEIPSNESSSPRPITYINWLKDDGLIDLTGKKYHLVNPILQKIDKALVYRLLAFAVEKTSKYPLSYHGEQMSEGIWDYIFMNEDVQTEDSPLIVHGSNFLRILDEHKVMLLQKVIQEKRYISHLYLTSDKPRVVKKNDINAMEKKLFLPIKLVYDHIYGRWYVIGRDNMKKVLKEGISFTVKKVDLISDMELLEQQPDKEVFDFYNKKIEKKLAQSWLVSQSNKVHEVKLKFSIQDLKIKQRLEREKRWGLIEELDEASVMYTISVHDYHEMRPWIRSFSHHVEVLQPASLVENVKNELEARLARYSDV